MYVVPTIHPSFVLRGNRKYEGVLQQDLNRAVSLVRDRWRPTWKDKSYVLRPSLATVKAWLKRAKGREIALDIEADGRHAMLTQVRCIGLYDGEADSGICIPIVYRDGSTEEYIPAGKKKKRKRARWVPWFEAADYKELIAELQKFLDAKGTMIIMQNGQYDRLTLRSRLGLHVGRYDEMTIGRPNYEDCYLESETEFLTGRGWLRYDAIGANDVLATVNPATGVMEFQKPYRRVDKAFTGDLHIWETPRSRCVVTPNHRMFTAPYWRATKRSGTFGFLASEKLIDATPDYAQFRVACAVTDDSRDTYEVDGVVLTPAWCRFLGLWIADGFADRENALGISQKKDGRASAALAELQQQLGLRCYAREHREGWRPEPITEERWMLLNTAWTRRVLGWCGRYSRGRQLPLFALQMPPNLRRALFEGLILGDASVVDRATIYRTGSPKLAADVQALALSLGQCATIYPCGDIQFVHMRNDWGETDLVRLRRKDSPNKGNVSIEHVENGRIVCFSVPNETLVTRSRGKPALHGNTIVAHHAVASFLQHGLAFLGSTYTDICYYKSTDDGDAWSAQSDDELWVYNLRDCRVTWLTWKKLREELRERPGGVDQRLYEHDMRKVNLCERMKEVGILVDLEARDALREFYGQKADAALVKMRHCVSDILGAKSAKASADDLDQLIQYMGDPDEEGGSEDYAFGEAAAFNPNSLRQLRIVLSRLSIPLSARTDSGELSTAEEYLLEARGILVDSKVKKDDPRLAFLDYLFAFRKNSKVKGTFLYPELVPDAYVPGGFSLHPTFSVHVVPTGRLASKRPNFQNQPKKVRGMFVARPGHSLVSGDWDSGELRLIALISGEKTLLDAFDAFDAGKGPKVHKVNASAIFKVPIEKVDEGSGIYRAAKVFAYAVNYGAGPQTVYDQVRKEMPDMSFTDFLRCYENFKKARPTLFAFQQKWVEQGTRQKFLDAHVLGRRVYYFEQAGGDSPEASAMLNMPCQAGLADVVDLANFRLLDRTVPKYRKKCKKGEHIEQLAQVHDELLFEVPDRLAEGFKGEFEEIAKEAPTPQFRKWKDKLPVQAKVSKRWAKLELEEKKAA